MSKITHEQHRDDFFAGYDAKTEEVRAMGWEAARNKFNLENPIGQNPETLGAFYYAKGEFEALFDLK